MPILYKKTNKSDIFIIVIPIILYIMAAIRGIPCLFILISSIVFALVITMIIMSIRIMKGIMVIAIVAIALTGSLFITALITATVKQPQPHIAAPRSPSSVVSVVSSSHPDGSWKMQSLANNKNRWVEDGIVSIEDAKTKADATAAAQEWLDQIKLDPTLLAAAGAYLLRESINYNDLISNDGWATEKAVQLYYEMRLTLADSKNSPATVSPTMTNTAYTSGAVQNETNRITGDLKAIEITTKAVQGKDSITIYILARCGNIVTETIVVINTPSSSSASSSSSSLTPCSALNDSGYTGGGKNSDPGTGVYTPPDQIEQPPTSSRVNPDPPSSDQSTSSSSSSTVSSDSTPPPPPQSGAATSSSPDSGYSPPPGRN
jgi:hypothetical protein